MRTLSHRSLAQTHQEVAKLLDQQFWRWGCDVKHPAGNLLVEYGFERIPPPCRVEGGSSAYRLHIDANRRIILRSFAVFFGDDRFGGILFKRFEGQAFRTPGSDLARVPHTELDLLRMHRSQDQPETRALTAALFRQIVDYETWVYDRHGLDYVEQTLSSRNKRPAVPADRACEDWMKLAMFFASP